MHTRTRVRPPGLLTAAVGLLAVAPERPEAQAAPGSPALTPPMGWNSWNTFGCGINEAHLALWALMAAPLMEGNDIHSMSADISAVLRNPRLILWTCNGQNNQKWNRI